MNNLTAKPRIAQRFHCARCRDKGRVLAPYCSDFQPCVREVCCPDCGGPRVVLATRQEVIDLLMVCAVIVAAFALWGGQ
jgi:hypothetical protein